MARFKKPSFFKRLRNFFSSKPKSAPKHAAPKHAARTGADPLAEARNIPKASERKGAPLSERLRQRINILKTYLPDRPREERELERDERRNEIFKQELKWRSLAEQSIFYQATQRAWQGVSDPRKRDEAILDYYRERFGDKRLQDVFDRVMRDNAGILDMLENAGALDSTLSWREQRDILAEFYMVLANVKTVQSVSPSSGAVARAR